MIFFVDLFLSIILTLKSINLLTQSILIGGISFKSDNILKK